MTMQMTTRTTPTTRPDPLQSFSPLHISNAVITGSTDTTFDLPMIFRFLEIQDPVVKLQFNDQQKEGSGISACKTFYNQVTFSLSNKANVKLFNNGKYQISGVKNLASARSNLETVLKLLPVIKGRIEVEPDVVSKVLCFNGRVLLKNEADIYHCSSGVYKNGFFMIDGNVCVTADFDDRLLVATRHGNEKKKNLYNIDCEYVGFVQYIMKRKNKNLCLKGAYFTKISDTSFLIHDKFINNVPIGEMNIHVTGNIKDHRVSEKVTLEFSACKGFPQITSMTLANINCNIKFQPNKSVNIDRDLLCKYLADMGVPYNFDPCKYPGVKFSHQNTKITIFRTGSVLFSGKHEIKDAILWIASVFNENDFVKTAATPTPEASEAIEAAEELSIWDIM
jgi:TATA-box binding protein (TBP) (component of TFIID and TFIIIB)